jgi:hypothetical protein
MSDTRPRQRGELALVTAIAVISGLAAHGQTGAVARPANPAGSQHAQTRDSVHTPTNAGQRPSPFREQRVSRNPGSKLTIPAGTAFSVRLAETVDAGQVRVNDRFFATLDAPITVDGRVVLPKGTRFEGHVRAAKTSGRFRGTGLLGLTLDSFTWRGADYRIQTYTEYRTSSAHRKRNAVLIGGGAGLGAALGVVSGVGAEIGAGAGAAAGTTTAFLTGKRTVKLPIETPLEFSLSANIDLRI